MRFIAEYERTPTEVLVTLAGAIRSLEIKSSVDYEQLGDIGIVVTRRVEKKIAKEERDPSGDKTWLSDEEDAKAIIQELRADIERQAEESGF
jgi:hypothetical protein